jgi:3-oxoacyl-[acyl-carrier-protein] synthase-3
MIRSVVRGIRGGAPEAHHDQRRAGRHVDTSDEWIVQRTGIRQRYIAGDDETTASLGEAAARAALANAGLTPADIDLIVLATSTPDNTFPGHRVEIQNRLGMSTALPSTCRRSAPASSMPSPPPTPISAAAGQARAGHRCRDVLAHSRLERPYDLRAVRRRRRRVVLEAEGRGHLADRGVLTATCAPTAPTRTSSMSTAARRPRARSAPAHGRPRGLQACGRHDHRRDRGTFEEDRHFRRRSRLVRAASGQQTHHRCFGQEAEHPLEKVVVTVDLHGNTSAASMPLALAAAADGRIKKGDLVLLEAMGGGFTWGAVLLRW